MLRDETLQLLFSSERIKPWNCFGEKLSYRGYARVTREMRLMPRPPFHLATTRIDDDLIFLDSERRTPHMTVACLEPLLL